MHISHTVVVTERNVINIAENRPWQKSLRVWNVALFVQKNSTGLMVCVIEPDTDAGWGIGIAALSELMSFFAYGDVKFNLTV